MRRPATLCQSQQPEPANSPGATVSRTHASPASVISGPDTHRIPAADDHRGMMVNVGADFFSAADLAELNLDGLPQRRDQISRRATKDGWPSRPRDGKGGGREFPLSALPDKARGEILRRRLLEASSKAIGNAGRPHAPLADIANLKASQAERLAARTALLDIFYSFKGDGSDRQSLDAFVAAFAQGLVTLPEWARPLITSLSQRTMKRWLAARKAGRDKDLAGRWAGGRKSIFDLSPELAEFVLGVHAKQPALRVEDLADLVADNFPSGVPDTSGLVLPCPSAATVGRFLKAWKGVAQNAATLAALNNPDRYRSKFRFAIGNASAGVERPNQRWQIDASPVDVMFEDGRSNMYVIVDVFSRRLNALIAKTPKTSSSLLLIARTCMAWGVPEEIWTDNGSDFTSKHFKLALQQLGVHHHLTPPYSPDRKPFIERAIGTIQSKFMPRYEGQGYAGNSVAMRAEIEARSSFAQRLGETAKAKLGAELLAGDVQDALLAWIANRYETRPHAGLGNRAPIDVWYEGVERHPIKMVQPQAIGPLLMPPVRDGVRIVTPKGIAVDGIDYYCDDLVVGQRVHVRLDPDNLGAVWVYTDSDPWQFIGIAKNLDLDGLDRAGDAARAKAMQAAIVKQGKADLRRMIRKADVHTAHRAFIGELQPAAPASSAITHLTPALEEAARAATTRGRRQIPEATPEEKADHEGFVASFAEARVDRRNSETPAQRYARWKELQGLLGEGAEISAESREWFESYRGTPEWVGQWSINDGFKE